MKRKRKRKRKQPFPCSLASLLRISQEERAEQRGSFLLHLLRRISSHLISSHLISSVSREGLTHPLIIEEQRRKKKKKKKKATSCFGLPSHPSAAPSHSPAVTLLPPVAICRKGKDMR